MEKKTNIMMIVIQNLMRYLNNSKKRGKEYVNDKLEFEGKYFYNKKWNGKGYDKNGNIIYELNKRNGKVREYKYDKLRFEGE